MISQGFVLERGVRI